MEQSNGITVQLMDTITIEQSPKRFVSETLNSMFQDNERGFDVFIIMKDDSGIKRFMFQESEDDSQNFKIKIENSIAEAINDKFLPEGVEFDMAENIADNQHKFYVIKQNDQYWPFKILNTPEDTIEPFSVTERDNAEAIIFRFRRDGKSIWAYQYIAPTNIPNKKKENFLAKVFTTENVDRFVEMNDLLFPITKKVNLLVIDEYIITNDTTLMQRHFKFNEFINAAAVKVVSDITALNLVSNADKLTEYINRTKTTYAKKMMRLKNYHVITTSSSIILEKLRTVPRWIGVFDVTEDKINLRTYEDVEKLIDLFDERFTISPVTGDEFDTDVKKLADPLAPTSHTR